MTQREEIKLMLTDLVVCKFASIDKHIAYVLGEDVNQCKAKIQEETALDITLVGEKPAIKIIAYIEKKCTSTEIAFAAQYPIVLHNKILPF